MNRQALQIGDTLYEGEAFFEGMAARRAGVGYRANPYAGRVPGLSIEEREDREALWADGHTVQDELIKGEACDERALRGKRAGEVQQHFVVSMTKDGRLKAWQVANIINHPYLDEVKEIRAHADGIYSEIDDEQQD